ncbi:MAG: hypothetical protein CMH54_10395 [Myxococcales bacterium]|nr:hypothetical protein [Myxococcales bacterium]
MFGGVILDLIGVDTKTEVTELHARRASVQLLGTKDSEFDACCFANPDLPRVVKVLDFEKRTVHDAWINSTTIDEFLSFLKDEEEDTTTGLVPCTAQVHTDPEPCAVGQDRGPVQCEFFDLSPEKNDEMAEQHSQYDGDWNSQTLNFDMILENFELPDFGLQADTDKSNRIESKEPTAANVTAVPAEFALGFGILPEGAFPFDPGGVDESKNLTETEKNAPSEHCIVTLYSYGHKYFHELPKELPTDLPPALDVRHLRDKVSIGRRPQKTALDCKVFEQIKAQPKFEIAVQKIYDLALKNGSAAAFCTSGRHRSVAVIEEAAKWLAQFGVIVTTVHMTVNWRRKGRVTVPAPVVAYKHGQSELGRQLIGTDLEPCAAGQDQGPVQISSFLAACPKPRDLEVVLSELKEVARALHSELTHLPADPKNCDTCRDVKVTVAGTTTGHARDEADATHKHYFVADLAGPFLPSRMGCRYLGVFFDVKRRLLYARGLRSKEDSDFIAFVASARKELKCDEESFIIYTDWEGATESYEWRDFLVKQSGTQSHSIPNLSNTNAIAERAVRLVEEGAVSQLEASNLGEIYWDESAVVFTVHANEELGTSPRINRAKRVKQGQLGRAVLPRKVYAKPKTRARATPVAMTSYELSTHEGVRVVFWDENKRTYRHTIIRDADVAWSSDLAFTRRVTDLKTRFKIKTPAHISALAEEASEDTAAARDAAGGEPSTAALVERSCVDCGAIRFLEVDQSNALDLCIKEGECVGTCHEMGEECSSYADLEPCAAGQDRGPAVPGESSGWTQADEAKLRTLLTESGGGVVGIPDVGLLRRWFPAVPAREFKRKVDETLAQMIAEGKSANVKVKVPQYEMYSGADPEPCAAGTDWGPASANFEMERAFEKAALFDFIEDMTWGMNGPLSCMRVTALGAAVTLPADESTAVRAFAITVSMKDARASQEWHKWRDAIDAELAGLLERGVLALVPIEEATRDDEILPSLLVLTYKPEMAKYKARLVACGNFSRMDPGLCHSPTVGKEVWMPLLCAMWGRGCAIRSVDIVQAYLQTDKAPKEGRQTFLRLPRHLVDDSIREKTLAQVLSNIYGKKNAGKLWYETFKRYLLSSDFTCADYDSTVFVRDGLLILLYVDDVVVIGRDAATADGFLERLRSRFDCTEPVKLEECTRESPLRFLTHEVYEDEQGRLHIAQELYVALMLEKWNCLKELKELNQEHFKDVWLRDGSPLDPKAHTEFRGKIGSLLYLGNGTRPDLLAPICIAAQGSAKPTNRHMEAADELLRYTKYTRKRHLTWARSSKLGFDIIPLLNQFDASYGMGNQPRSGYCLYVDENLCAWRTKKQTAGVLSTCEAELVASTVAGRDTVGLRNLFSEVLPIFAPQSRIQVKVTLQGDNDAANAIASGDAALRKVRHLDQADLYIRKITAEYGPILRVNTNDNSGDSLTKALGRQKLEPLLSIMGLV